jgi:hypothetical protein
MRIYLPATIPLLLAWRAEGTASPEGSAYAVTPSLREWYREGDADELEYAAGLAAGMAALGLLAADPSAPRRRVVLAAEVADSAVTPEPSERGAVRLGGPIPVQTWASVLVDDLGAVAVVSAAVAALDAAARGDADAEFALDEAAATELGWFGIQELDSL